MTDTPQPEALAADPRAGTDAAAAPGEPGDVTVAAVAAAEPAPRTFWARLDHPFGVGLTLTLGGLAALLFGLAVSNLATVLIYIVFGMFAALGLDPVIRKLEARGIKRVWGITIVFFGGAVLLVAVLWLILPTVFAQIGQFFSDIPGLVNNFEKSDFYAWLEGIFGTGLNTLVTEIENFLLNPANIAAITGGALKIGVGIATAISGLVIIIVLTLYFVSSLQTIKEAFYRLTPARGRARLASMTDQITDSVGGYLMGMVILAFCNSIVAFLLHLFLGLPFPALMAVVAFLITLIPLVGSVLFWIIASTLALFTSPLSALIFAAIYLVYMQIEAYVMTPRVMNRTISIPGSLVIIGALVGGTLLGLLGALVAIPVTASILLIVKQVWVPKQDAKV